mgnify:CR=1 FL=1
MPTKIRLARHGRKRKPFYHIVIADGRAPRDGKFIERVGSYNPNTNPATIELDFDKTLEWLQKGAQPTDTVRAILGYKGVLHMNHLLGGVKKGAFTEEVAKEKFNDWLEEKAKSQKKKLAAETKIKEERAAALAAKNSELAGEEEAAKGEEVAEATEGEEVVAEAPVTEAPVTEAPVEETPAEEKKEEKSE